MSDMETNRTNRTWTNVGPNIYVSNDGVKIERVEDEGEVMWMSTFLEEHIPPSFAPTLEDAMLEADAIEYDMDANGLWVVR